METLFFLLFHLIFMVFYVNSDNTLPAEDTQDSVTRFQPSLPVVIGMLSIMFSITFILLLYAKFCYVPSDQERRDQNGNRVVQLLSRNVGIDKTVIESLPFFRFSLLKGSREGLECAVCLSKFDDIEVLRLLPKCKHAFHIDCIDQWLEKHSSCPLCRQKVGSNDLSQMPYSESFRFLWNQSELGEASNIELYVQREESNHLFVSSRFSISEKQPISNSEIYEDFEEDYEDSSFHRFNHEIVVSEGVFKNRWSNVTSSDIISLNSDMIHDQTCSRFEQRTSLDNQMTNGESIKKDPTSSVCVEEDENPRFGFKISDQNNQRSMSEIIIHPRFTEKDTSVDEISVKDERIRKIWIPIARRTIHWLANRETTTPQSRGT